MITPQKKAKLTWRCRRGMLELDLIFNRFLTQHIDQLTPEQLNVFEQLLECQDPDLYAWLMGYDEPDMEFAEIVALIQCYNKAE